MTRAIKASEIGLASHYKVRVSLPGSLVHLASMSEPVIVTLHGRVADVTASWISDHEYGDTIGYIDWQAVIGITWRYSP